MQRFMIFVLSIYLIVLAFGMNFLLSAIGFGLLGTEVLIISSIFLIPGIFILLYAFRFNIGSLDKHEKALHYLIYITLAVAVVFSVLVLIPLTYA